MTIAEFFQLRTGYEAKARARSEERQNHGDDTSWQVRVLEEMVMDLIGKVNALQSFNADLYGDVKAPVDTPKPRIAA